MALSMQSPRLALNATEIVQHLSQINGEQASGWRLMDEALEKTFDFGNFYETMAFVNALAFIAHAEDHHPDLAVSYGKCTVRFSTHDVAGISSSDFDCAAKVDRLMV